MQRKPDISLATNTLGWEPTVALEQGLIKTIQHFKTLAI
jgi:UDP-glucuronate decarboxylase